MNEAIRKIWEINSKESFPQKFHEELERAIGNLTNVMYEIETKSKTDNSVMAFLADLKEFVEADDGLEFALIEGNVYDELSVWQLQLKDTESANRTDNRYEVRPMTMKIKAEELYSIYQKYCAAEQRPVVSNAKFGRDIRKHITKSRTKAGCIYDLKTIDP